MLPGLITTALIPSSFNSSSNDCNAIKKLIKNRVDFTAVITLNDLLSIGVYRAVHESGLRIPDDISVVGNDNINLSEFLNPPLTTINQPKLLLGYKSAKLLLKIIDGKDIDTAKPETIMLEAKLIKRGSVRKINKNN